MRGQPHVDAEVRLPAFDHEHRGGRRVRVELGQLGQQIPDHLEVHRAVANAVGAVDVQDVADLAAVGQATQGRVPQREHHTVDDRLARRGGVPHAIEGTVARTARQIVGVLSLPPMRAAIVSSVVLALGVCAPVAVAQERGASGTPSRAKPSKPATDRSRTRRKRRKKPTPPPRHDVPPAAPAGEVTVEIRSVPRGADIWVDGRKVGVAPVTARVRPGRRVFRATLAGHVRADTTLVVEPNMGYLVFSLAREPTRPAAVAGGERPAPPPARAPAGRDYDRAMLDARLALRRERYRDALGHAQAALAAKPGDPEAQMIATIAACGVGDAARARRTLPAARGSYREVSIARCRALGVTLP
ncbi:MAG: PEGA domain-containing protein [Deltaproteobacteria bacterium]|nr:MAG: PEGA domain-containing protein [Deltaproteobacteria bacterium]